MRPPSSFGLLMASQDMLPNPRVHGDDAAFVFAR